MCGEKPPIINAPGTYDGSPPRVRGEVDHAYIDYPSVRITPACAGRSRRLSTRRARMTDHPRVCGEK